jgi:hypothetical protein
MRGPIVVVGLESERVWLVRSWVLVRLHAGLDVRSAAVGYLGTDRALRRLLSKRR